MRGIAASQFREKASLEHRPKEAEKKGGSDRGCQKTTIEVSKREV